jgi:hypothetical protein
MTRLRWVVLVLAVLVAGGSVSFQPAQTFEFVTSTGTPAGPVYVAYSYLGSRPNFVHPVTYEARPLALRRGDEAGRVAFERSVIMHRPFPLETHPALWTDMVYAPSLHNAWGQLNPGSPSYTGVFEIDSAGRRATVGDLSDRPDRWEGTMRNLASVISRLIATPEGEAPLRERDPASAALTRELIGHFRQEYDAFLARYSGVDRPRPEMPDFVRMSGGEEQRRWIATIDADLAREPRWGMVVTRLFRIQLRQFEEWATAPG